MLNSLYIEAARKKISLEEIVPELDNESTIFDNWNNLNIKPSLEDFSIGAGDGSFNKKKFLNFNFYAIASESLIFDGELKTIEKAEIDTIPHYSNVDDLLRTYMGIFELKSCLETIENYGVDYYLYDGSLLGDLIRPFPNRANLSKEKRQELIDLTFDDLNEGINSSKEDLLTPQLIKKYFVSNVPTFDYSIFLANIEKLLLLNKILQHNKKIIAISKTSINNEIFESTVPDMAIFDKYTNFEGLSKLIYKEVSDETKHVFPICNDFFKDLEFTIFYLRLDYGKNILKIELPYKATLEEVYDICEKLKKYSTEGYPYLLKKAHKDVVISNRNIGELVNIVNVHAKSGREMLR